MPLGWVDPETYMEHKGVTVYHVYKDDMMDQNPPRDFWYTIDPTRGEDYGEDDGVFDITDYNNPNRHNLNTDEGRQALMRELIERGVLGDDGVVHPELDEEDDETSDEKEDA